jgi:SAM-dependent methyltransferase
MSDAHGSTPAFGAYAGFYDALYADKDYEAEVEFLFEVFSAQGVSATASVLDLGCGTGGHVIPLVQRGFRVTGVDRSAEMLARAQAKADVAGASVTLLEGDVRDVDAGGPFDVVTSMFAVVSYQLTNADLAAMFSTARRHLEQGGLFVFDGWFGPAVLTERPEVKTKVVTEPSGDTITRVARPVLDIVAQTVEVNYDVARERDGRLIEKTSESHAMRFLFAREIELFLSAAGFELVAFGPFMELDRTITEHDWNFSAVARAV